MTVLSKQSAEEYKKENYTARMDRTGRPVSPHVFIYSFPVAALTSITNRVCGVALSGMCVGWAAADVAGGSGTALSLMQDLGSMSVIGPLTKFSVGFPLMFHYLGGLRHTIWDKNPGQLTTEDVEKTSYALVGASTLFGLGVCVM
eukprot:CAMPEP_0195514466 /NCGR_PEP_ID=MMETSP0794_2-20130614/5843_1 /TAXON_ID=515487 /ORGANISM="Stephanopyxis turris, Strain CCMP 815" /LENGTH=144 /DNA_ID=CAMNT_0040642719 /DNA_START=198 /DNA_END=632 /DNA_ORIENTATION=+